MVETETHLNEFANEGLRMVLLVYEVIAGMSVWLDSDTLAQIFRRGECYHAGTVAIKIAEPRIVQYFLRCSFAPTCVAN